MDFEKLIDYRNRYNRFSTRIGIVLEELRLGYARARKTVEVDDTNPLGYAQGGVYFTLADSACGSAAYTYGYQAARPGDLLTAVATELHHGKTTAVFEVRITDQRDALLGSGTFTFYLLPEKLELH